MNWRQHFPAWYRARRVRSAIAESERAELEADRFRSMRNPVAAARFDHIAMQWYLTALKWRPLDNPGELPSPELNIRFAEVEAIECIICGTPIPRPTRATAAVNDGLYCPRCR